MNIEEIKKAKKEMELKIYEAIKEFESKTGLVPHSIDLDMEYRIGGHKLVLMVTSQVEI